MRWLRFVRETTPGKEKQQKSRYTARADTL
jgi:hypothetical protein